MKRITMKDIPADERPYEKCLKEGPEGLSDEELESGADYFSVMEENLKRLEAALK